MRNKDPQVYWRASAITVDDRRNLCGHQSCVIWFTGLPASGKSTVANALCRKLHSMRVLNYILDGDSVRQGLNRDLGFGPEDRKENIRRVAEVARLFVDAGLIVLAAFISPYREDRDMARGLLQAGEFIETYVKCSPEECERRDPKGMYRKARAGLIAEFTGVSAPYEEPLNPEIILETDQSTVDDCVNSLIEYLVRRELIRAARVH